MRKCLVNYYLDPKTNKEMWSCNQGLSLSCHPATSTRCWRHNCPGIKERPVTTNNICNYIKCTNPVRNVTGAKYCSLKCKSKESSRIYRLKMKAKK